MGEADFSLLLLKVTECPLEVLSRSSVQVQDCYWVVLWMLPFFHASWNDPLHNIPPAWNGVLQIHHPHSQLASCSSFF